MLIPDEALDEHKRNVLNRKLESILIHCRKLKEQKKASAAAFKEQIDACHKKIDSLADTLQTGDLTHLHEGFNQWEREDLFYIASMNTPNADQA